MALRLSVYVNQADKNRQPGTHPEQDNSPGQEKHPKTDRYSGNPDPKRYLHQGAHGEKDHA